MRSNAGRAVFPRVLDVMEGRSATVLRDLFADPRLSVVSSWWPVVRRLGWVAARFGIPLQVAQALARPAAARRRLDRLGRRLRQPPMPPTSTTAQERLDLVVRLLGDAVVRIVPGSCRLRQPGSRCWDSPVGCSGPMRGRATWRPSSAVSRTT